MEEKPKRIHDEFRDKVATVLRSIGLVVGQEVQLNDSEEETRPIPFWKEELPDEWKGRVDILVIEPLSFPIEIVISESYAWDLGKIKKIIKLWKDNALEKIVLFEPTKYMMKTYWKTSTERKSYKNYTQKEAEDYTEINQFVLKKWREEKLIPDNIIVEWWNEETLEKIERTKKLP